jgi:hypothetical protein
MNKPKTYKCWKGDHYTLVFGLPHICSTCTPDDVKCKDLDELLNRDKKDAKKLITELSKDDIISDIYETQVPISKKGN